MHFLKININEYIPYNMNSRSDLLKKLRGEAIGDLSLNTLSEERYQNEVLRPIMRFQNELFIVSLNNYFKKNKIDFGSFSIDKKIVVIDSTIKKDFKYRSELIGMIIGLFTDSEFDYYLKNETSLNKRISGMLIERLKSQIQILG